MPRPRYCMLTFTFCFGSSYKNVIPFSFSLNVHLTEYHLLCNRGFLPYMHCLKDDTKISLMTSHFVRLDNFKLSKAVWDCLGLMRHHGWKLCATKIASVAYSIFTFRLYFNATKHENLSIMSYCGDCNFLKIYTFSFTLCLNPRPSGIITMKPLKWIA